MRRKKINKILLQMYDIKPVDKNGDLNVDELKKIKRADSIFKGNNEIVRFANLNKGRSDGGIFYDIKPDSDLGHAGFLKLKKSFKERNVPYVLQFGEIYESDDIPNKHKCNFQFEEFTLRTEPEIESTDQIQSENQIDNLSRAFGISNLNSDEEGLISLDEILLRKYFRKVNIKKSAFSFNTIAAGLFMIILSIGFIYKGVMIKGLIIDNGENAYQNLALAKEQIINKNFQKSNYEFNEAYIKFGEVVNDLGKMGNFFVEVTKYIPYFSKVSSGSHIAKAGQDISRIGILTGDILRSLENIKNPLNKDQSGGSVSLLTIFQDGQSNSKEILSLLDDAEKNLSEVNINDLPEDKRAQFIQLKERIPEIKGFISNFLDNGFIFTDILGGNGPRKYLFLFQNNQEMRATGGFIGTYGVLDIFNGRIRKFFIDGIFNPDGQLRERVVPPTPLQKMSAVWSLHDSNWFPDFPVSAEKATYFYEKTGGPTVDGVITMTPTVMQKLLEITGPIEMPEYDLVVDKDNFIEKIQYKVELDYDKELNQPKQILADLAPKILDKIFNMKKFTDLTKTMNVLIESLNEKQILIYSKNYDIQKKISSEGWSGEVLNSDKDYLSVINTNINGYKTDGVVEEKIEHGAEIQDDGSIVNTVTITRHHNGGNSEYEWWNKVNADYMRVYVPKGSRLISAEGQTREFNSPPLDYKALNFKRDPQVLSEEENIRIDEQSGTRVYDDANKTVFANWVYVSPQETVVVKYKYLLPFMIKVNESDKPADTYSLIIQKQSGSLGSQFFSKISYATNFKVIWQYPDNLRSDGNQLNLEAKLITDKFIGIALSK